MAAAGGREGGAGVVLGPDLVQSRGGGPLAAGRPAGGALDFSVEKIVRTRDPAGRETPPGTRSIARPGSDV